MGDKAMGPMDGCWWRAGEMGLRRNLVPGNSHVLRPVQCPITRKQSGLIRQNCLGRGSEVPGVSASLEGRGVVFSQKVDQALLQAFCVQMGKRVSGSRIGASGYIQCISPGCCLAG